MEVYTKQYGGEATCAACIRQRHGGHSQPPPHTCLSHRSAAQIASDERAKRLRQLDRQARQRAEHPAGSDLRTRSMAARFQVR